MQNDIVNKNYAEFIEMPAKNETSKSRFTDIQLETLRKSIGIIPYIEALGFLDDLTPHSCRRTFSTRMRAAGEKAGGYYRTDGTHKLRC